MLYFNKLNKMDTIHQLNAFNDVVGEFMEKMIKTFPEEKKLNIWYLHFKTSKAVSKGFPMKYVMESLKDLGYPILTKDERFFKKNEYVEYAEGFSEKTGLVNIWESTSDQVKDSIWQYMQSIYVLGMRCIGEQGTLNDVITKIQNNTGDKNINCI
jgi:hypothetical protein